MRNRGRRRYKLLPHTTDAYIEVRAPTIAAAFEDAAFAMFDIMTDPSAVGTELTDSFDVTAHDEISLLHDWLEELLLRFELDGKVYSDFHVDKMERQDENLHLTATTKGGLFQRGRHPAKVEVKAVTYHRMEVRTSKEGCIVRYILDL